MMKDVPSLLPPDNGELHDYEVRYVMRSEMGAALCEHTVRQSKSLKNALASFARAVPRHGPIKGIKKVVAK